MDRECYDGYFINAFKKKKEIQTDHPKLVTLERWSHSQCNHILRLKRINMLCSKLQYNDKIYVIIWFCLLFQGSLIKRKGRYLGRRTGMKVQWEDLLNHILMICNQQQSLQLLMLVELILHYGNHRSSVPQFTDIDYPQINFDFNTVNIQSESCFFPLKTNL